MKNKNALLNLRSYKSVLLTNVVKKLNVYGVRGEVGFMRLIRKL